jgi:hypothetical protein
VTTRTSRLLLSAAAVVNLGAAVPLLFAPVELLRALGAGPSRLEPLLAQLLATALFGLGLLNWTSRHSPIGGIYGRPLVVANLAHTFAAAMALGRFVAGGAREPALLAMLLLYAALAAGFGYALFGRPASAATVQATFAGD